MKFTDCIEIVGSKPTLYEGTKQYVSTGAVEEYFINKNSIEEYTYNERPSRADLVGKSGDILFAKMAETKKTLILDKETENYLFSTGFFAIRPKSGILTTKCLYYLLNSKNFLSQKDKNSSGATQKAITNAGLEKINVNIPLFSKQDQIVKQFDLLTDIIKKYQSQLKKLDSLIKSRFIEMFGDNPIENGKWKVEKLGNLGLCKNGMNFSYEDNGFEINCLGVGDFKDNAVISNCEKLPVISLNEKPSEEYLLKDNDIVFVRSNGNKELVGRSVLVHPRVLTTFSGFCIRFRLSTDSINHLFLLQFLKMPNTRKNMAGRGANIQNLNQQILSNLDIPVPKIELQNDFASFVQQIDKSKFAVQKSLEKAETLYKSLMQRYFA